MTSEPELRFSVGGSDDVGGGVSCRKYGARRDRENLHVFAADLPAHPRGRRKHTVCCVWRFHSGLCPGTDHLCMNMFFGNRDVARPTRCAPLAGFAPSFLLANMIKS